MNYLFCIICFLTATASCKAYKVVIFAPAISDSQVLFNARVAETLADAGGDVTVAQLHYFPDEHINVKYKENVKFHHVNVSSGSYTYKNLEENHSKGIFQEMSMFNSQQKKHMRQFMGNFLDACRIMATDKEFLFWLENEKFDVAFVHMYHMCPIGIVHAAKIPSWVWLLSGGLRDNVATAVGVPLIPSYVPPMMMDSTDRLTFYERVKSVIGHTLAEIIWPRFMIKPETTILREEFGADFPDLLDLAAECPLVMVNSNEFYDFPRPTLAKVINIGGVGYQMKKPKPLTAEFQEIVDKAEGIVLFSFGSHAPAHMMPEVWKQAFLETFERFPEYQFILRYSSSDLRDRASSNVHFFDFIPQSDLLQNTKTKLFISHGGANSLQESVAAGVPIVAIPLFGDQHKNSKIAMKHGFGKVIEKSEIATENLYNAIKEVLNNPRYAEVAQRMRKLSSKQPFSAEEKLVKWTEFLAEFKTLENLQPAGTKLNYFQYHSIDVYGLLTVVVLVFVVFLYKISMCLYRGLRKVCGRGQKTKVD